MICRECGATMKIEKRVKKATHNRRAVYRYKCSCGYEEAGNADDKKLNVREDHLTYTGFGSHRELPKPSATDKIIPDGENSKWQPD